VPSLPVQIGRYQILDRLGEGGMGVVYLARDPELQRTIAIKMLSGGGDAEYDGEMRERFAREARSAAGLKHNHIVTIYDIGEDQNRPFIAMEFLDGESMAQLIERRAQMSVERKMRLALELCSGLGHAHRLGLIHRDMKPANLMITSEGALKILDFGLARAISKVTNADLTQVGMLMGTPHYMSPEQVLGQPVDQRSDIFSVGAVLYELFTYRRAFEAATLPLVLHQILQGEPAPIRSMAPSVAPDLERAIAKALHKNPDNRYQSLTALAADLEQAVTAVNAAPAADVTVLMPAPAAAMPAQAVVETPAAPTIVRPRPVEAAKAVASPPPRAVSRRPLILALAGLIIAVVGAMALYVFLVKERIPERAAAPSVPSVAPSTSAAGETAERPPAAPPPTQTPEVVPSRPAEVPVSATVPAAAARPAVAAPTPAPAVSVKPPTAAASTPPRTAATARRCVQLNEQASLGETLSQADRDFLAQQCRN
jgi:serine/threonine-protein kinase